MSTSNKDLSAENLQIHLKNGLKIIRDYDWLINSYVLDFYVNDHWSQLPKCWTEVFESFTPQDFGEVLSDARTAKLWPLSLLSLRAALKALCIPRSVTKQDEAVSSSFLTHPKLKNLFTKCVKPKKRHEIQKMAQICQHSSSITGTKYIVDFGAGLGHLARVLTYGYGMRVCCLEMQQELNDQARIIDHQLEAMSAKYLSEEQMSGFVRPVHITFKLTTDVTPDDFLRIIRDAFKINETDSFSFGIIGLHPCGDLGAILMRLFLDCKEAKFLNFVGCCYNKLTTFEKDEKSSCYPLSRFLRNQAPSFTQLSYESREISCHAAEMYEERLRNGLYENLKVHSFRATIERIIVKHWPHLMHAGLKSIKHTSSLTFEEYCKKAVTDLNIEIPLEDVHSTQVEIDLSQWKLVVIFYTLRLMFAPLIETVILYDRILYLKENGCHAEIEPIFDPIISPRNHITTAVKCSEGTRIS